MATWFKMQIEDRGWSLRETARRLDVSHTTIVNLVNGRSKPSVELCKRIAHTFSSSHLEVMRLAGLLDPAPPDTVRLEEVKQLFTELTGESKTSCWPRSGRWWSASSERPRQNRVHNWLGSLIVSRV